MKRLLVMLLVPIMSMYFVSIDTYESDMQELESRIVALEEGTQEDELLNHTFMQESKYFTISLTFENGLPTTLEVCAKDTGECEIDTSSEDDTLYYESDINRLNEEIAVYLETLDYLYENNL